MARSASAITLKSVYNIPDIKSYSAVSARTKSYASNESGEKCIDNLCDLHHPSKAFSFRIIVPPLPLTFLVRSPKFPVLVLISDIIRLLIDEDCQRGRRGIVA